GDGADARPSPRRHRADPASGLGGARRGAAERSSPPACRKLAGLVLREHRRGRPRDHRLRYRRPSGRWAQKVAGATDAERAWTHGSNRTPMSAVSPRETQGAEQPVGQWSFIFRDLILDLRGGFRSVALDFRGLGWSQA